MGKKMILVDADTLMGMGFNNQTGRTIPQVDSLKMYKRVKKMLAEEEAEKKKNAPKKEEGFMKDWSVAKRTAFFALAGPPLGLAYIFTLLMVVRSLSAFVVGMH